jgi:integrase/recombinase XerD
MSIFDINKNFCNLFDEYLLNMTIRFSKQTVITYTIRINAVRLAVDMEHMEANSLTLQNAFKSSCISFIISMSEYTVNYKNLTIAVINDFCKFCCRYYKILCKIHFDQLRKPQPLPKFIEQKKLLKIIKNNEVGRKTWIDYRNYALIYLLYGTGMRISEALGISMTDFHRDGMLLVRNGKNSKERVIYHPLETIEHIKIYRLLCPYNTTMTIWRSRAGGTLTRNAATRVITNYLGYSPHILRHSFATHLHSNGCDIFILSELLGHSTLMSTQIYTKIQKNELRQCVLKYHPLRKA